AAFSAEAGCLLGKSRRLRGPGAQHRARRRGVLSLRQVSLHKQRKVARAVTARKPLILISAEPEQQADRDPPYEASGDSRRVKIRRTRLLPAMQKSKSSSLRSHPHPPSGHLLTQAGEGLFTLFPASWRRAVHPVSRKREKGCSTDVPQAEKGCSTDAPQPEKGCSARFPRAASPRRRPTRTMAPADRWRQPP